MQQGLEQKEITGPYLQDYAGPGAASTKRWRQVFGQRLNVTSLVLSDVLLALLSLKVATLLQDVWGRGALTELAIATAVPAVALWVGLRFDGTISGLWLGRSRGSTKEHVRRVHGLGHAGNPRGGFSHDRFALAFVVASLLL
jgi:hypothetical protein